jgi:hypothetical protein
MFEQNEPPSCGLNSCTESHLDGLARVSTRSRSGSGMWIVVATNRFMFVWRDGVNLAGCSWREEIPR